MKSPSSVSQGFFLRQRKRIKSEVFQLESITLGSVIIHSISSHKQKDVKHKLHKVKQTMFKNYEEI